MSERWEQELELLRASWPELDRRDQDGQRWCRLPSYKVPAPLRPTTVEVAFRIPTLPGEAPYGFWVRPGVELVAGGSIQNYSYPATTPWGDDWGQFSWSAVAWAPKENVRAGSNMVNFVRSFVERLAQGA